VTYANDLHAQDKHSKLKANSRLPHYQLPRQFRELTATKAEIYQINYDDGIAFLVKILDRSKKRLSTGSNLENEPSHGGGRRFESGRAHFRL